MHWRSGETCPIAPTQSPCPALGPPWQELEPEPRLVAGSAGSGVAATGAAALGGVTTGWCVADAVLLGHRIDLQPRE